MTNTNLAFSPQERALAVLRLQNDGIDSQRANGGAEYTHWQAFKQAVGDWRTWVFVLLFVLDVGAGTIRYVDLTVPHHVTSIDIPHKLSI